MLSPSAIRSAKAAVALAIVIVDLFGTVPD